MKWKLLTTLLILFVLSTSTASAQIIKELPTKTELENFTTSLTQNADYIDNATLQTIAQHPTWPHDVWRDKQGNYYKSFYYSDIGSDKGYTSVYYDSCGKKLRSVCNIDFELVYAYPGLEVEENDTDPIEEVDPVEDGTIEENTTPNESQNYKYVELENSTVLASSGNNSGSMNTVKNSSGVINTQGNGNWVQQLKFVISDVKNSTVNFFVNLGQ